MFEDKLVIDKMYRRLFYIVVACLFLILFTGVVVVRIGISGQNVERNVSQAEVNQAVALCLASVESELTRQTTLALIEVSDPNLSDERRDKLNAALTDLNAVLTELVNVEDSSNGDICQRAVELNVAVNNE